MDGIGKIILEERSRQKISQEELSQGICSAATLSRLEWGEQNIGKWRIDALLQRLGKSQDSFWTIVHIGDYNQMEHRRTIWHDILCGEYRKAEKGMKEYECNGSSQNLHRQFLLTCEGMIQGKRDNNWKEGLRILGEAISITVPGFAIDKIAHLVLGREEITIIMLIAEAYLHLEEDEISAYILEGVLENIHQRQWDEEELVKIYPKVVKNYVPFLQRKDRYEDVILFSQKAVNMLIDNGIIFLLADLMEYILWGLERRGKVEDRRLSIQEEQEYIQLKKHVEVLQELWEEYGNIPKECMVYCTNVQKDISVSNELIAKCRKLCNLSQEELSENVCTAEHFSRIERGKCSPLEKSYRVLMEKMNQVQERNRFFINAQKYTLYERMRKIEKYINGQESRKAAAEWKLLRKEIAPDSLNNQQYIARYDTIIRYYNKQICIRKAIQEYKEALKITMPDYERTDITKWPLSRNEMFLLINIANGYCLIGKNRKAKHIYYALWNSIMESNVDSIYHTTEFKLIAYNIGVMEVLDKEYEKAHRILEWGMKCCMAAGRFEMIPSFLFIFCEALRNENRENDKKARHLMEQAFYLSVILKLPTISNKICNYYEELWNSIITY